MAGQSQIVSRSDNKSTPQHPVQVLLPLTTPPRPRSNSAILSWAASVQPGSPSRSPRRRSIVSRRPSIGHAQASAGSFINLIETPSPNAHEFDLTNLGYSSVFVQFPGTPSTPKTAANPYAHIPIPPVPASPTKPRRGLKHFRSLSALTRSRSKSVSDMPPPTPSKTQFFAVSIAKRKKAQYKYVRPAPLANELAIMQFADGGSLESHAKRVMAHQAKSAGPGVGVGEVFRDGNGGLWWDEDEEWEYAHLLAGEQQLVASQDQTQWVQFEGKENEGLAGEERRGSVSTQDSDLDARHLVCPAEDEFPFVPLALRRPGASVLALPARGGPRRHRADKPAFLVDPAFYAPRSPKGAMGPPSPLAKPKGSARRRPAPLKFARPHQHAVPVPAPVRTADVRHDFLAASFAPAPAPPTPATPRSPTSPRVSIAPKGKPSVLNMRALFRRRD